MNRRLYRIYLIMCIILVTLVLGGCSSPKDNAEETIKRFVEKHYVVDTEDLEMWNEYNANGVNPKSKLSKKAKTIAELMTGEAYNLYEINRTFGARIKYLCDENCRAEVKDITITEKEKSEDMRCFNIKFNWIIKNEQGEIVKEELMDKDMYLSDDHGKWLINHCNKFEIIYKDKDFIIVGL
ncbi:hypothetical protein [Clostridium sp.]|uniref:hypothetical protein n=1 Tax=Clostridium sp. TaxID=1506 RepID=UPI0032168A73